MSKVKPPKSKGVPNKHLHVRLSYLYQAATYLTLQTTIQDTTRTGVTQDGQTDLHDTAQTQRQSALALELGSDIQQVSRKGQLRLAVDLKRSMCKSCNAVLIPGRTATQVIENLSKGGKKPWADVLVVTCSLCGGKKRFPVDAKKQLKKAKRRTAPIATTSITASEDDPYSDTTVPTVTE
ncbi:hypothetical protein CFE70_003580 [Pyrenophora teres f. teres 0-1]|uniref:Rpr2-domain-containing protein n=2 Tax=Pyrenophora teres f. teres TaxID=97479 RepID=E3RDD3_PYRTT|nr:hypothetical protein PTT_01994 [Pyrenophora teres f. teres 0-1]KAE8845961.1 hypothetical protein HRS9139_00528 [Pyrenophora teres f. teres]KAE8848099.1 hypothetical protein PTNB85_01942 [Pyrenophora teres f. teres]KAE8853738.1 hypothetical protein HRS9122_00730 [Pyrenophora teres f. teres]KAE8868024.1 hypothetical protein PTNB29_01935 [Pyrenophora teres f. teres]